MLDQLVEGVCEELVTEPRDVGGPFQPYVPGNGRGSLPSAIGTNVFTFLAMVCEAALLEPTGFYTWKSRKRLPHKSEEFNLKPRDGDSGGEGCKRSGGEKHRATAPQQLTSPSPLPPFF